MQMKPDDRPCSGTGGGAEWLVMLALLAGDRQMLTRTELQRELSRSKDDGLPDLDDEIESLHAGGLVNVCGELVGASRAARYMHELLGRPA
jgi:hypothetical protein